MNYCRAVSELVGTLILISIVALAISVVSVALLSQPVPEDIPQLTAFAENQSRTIYLTHTGGNALDSGEIRIIVNGIESPFVLEDDSSWPWSPGEKLIVTYEGPGMPEYLQLIYRGGSAEALLLTEYFVPMNITGTPTTVITTVPSTIPTTLPTTVPTPEPSCSGVNANFTANVTSGFAPLVVSFTDNSTSQDPITSWSWNFGDGSTSTQQNPTHTYSNPGTYSVTLTATNNCGNSATTIKLNYITVVAAPSCGTITGTKYHDLNQNGQRDPGEPGLSGWTIQIFRKSGNNWIFVTSVTTGPGGIYTATGLQYQPAQQYLVKEIVQPGWIRTQPATEDYYSFIVLNQGHCYELGVDFGNWRVPSTTLNTQRGGHVQNGGQVQFTVTGSNSWVTIGGITYNLNSGDSISLTVNGDSTNVEIDMNGNRISRFAFPDVTVTRNGNSLGRGTINSIWISQYSGLTSSLSIVVPAVPSAAWTRFEYNGVTLINGNNIQRIELFNLYPRSSDGFMRLDVKNNNVYYDGGATGYQIT